MAHDGVFLEDFPVISAQERDKLKQKLYNSSPGEFGVTYAGSTQHGKGVDLMEKVAGTVSEKFSTKDALLNEIAGMLRGKEGIQGLPLLFGYLRGRAASARSPANNSHGRRHPRVRDIARTGGMHIVPR